MAVASPSVSIDHQCCSARDGEAKGRFLIRFDCLLFAAVPLLVGEGAPALLLSQMPGQCVQDPVIS